MSTASSYFSLWKRFQVKKLKILTNNFTYDNTIPSQSLGVRMKAPVMLAAPNSYQDRRSGKSEWKHLFSTAIVPYISVPIFNWLIPPTNSFPGRMKKTVT